MEVTVSGSRSTTDSWAKAQVAPVSELPVLTPDQEKVAARYVGSREQFARSVYAAELARPELERKAANIASLIERLVKEHLSKATVDKAVLETLSGTVRVFLNIDGEDIEIDIDEGLVDELKRTGSKELLERLERIVRLSVPISMGQSLAS
ncbi:MAG TPA: hypothetical protein VGD59_13980 [Acidisarcina sp.]